MPSVLDLRKRAAQILERFTFTRRSVPVALIILTILAYGLLINKLGFYWDDWPWIWWSHFFGTEGLLQIDQGYRPLSGVILWLGGLAGGKSPIVWQAINLIYRGFAGVAFWWALTKIFPGRLERTVWIAFIFLIYPGFGQQFISINSSRHILPMGFFFLSIGFMAWAIQKKARYWLFTGLALLFSLAAALSTDYFFGLELVRPLIIWIILKGKVQTNQERIKLVFKYWLPFLIVFTPLVAWRYIISPTANYEVELMEDFSQQPATTVVSAVRQLFENSFSSSVTAWGKLVEFPTGTESIRYRRVVMYWALTGITLVLCLFYLFRFRRDAEERGIWKSLIGLGLVSLFAAALPFLAAQIPLGLNFPSDRTTLPMAFGASMLFVGLVELLARKRALMIVLVSIAVALSTGAQFINAAKYEEDWETQKSLVRQLILRIPNLEPNTALVYQYTTALQEFHSTSNSLTPMFNLVYAPDIDEMKFPYYFMDLRVHAGLVADALKNGSSIHKPYNPFDFEAPPGNLLAIQFMPPWCLQVLTPDYARLYPHLPDELAASVAFSNPGLIEHDSALPVQPLEEIFGTDETPGWCEYYQMAEVARQMKDWKKVVEIGDEAFQGSGYPQQPSERLPFILGYGYLERWDRAVELTLETLRRDKNTVPMLCHAWSDLADNAPKSPDQEKALAQVQKKLACSGSD